MALTSTLADPQLFTISLFLIWIHVVLQDTGVARLSPRSVWLRGEDSTSQSRRHGFYPWSRKIPHALEQLSTYATTIEPVL